MRVVLLKSVILRGEIRKSGTFDVPDATAKHWIAAGCAKLAVDQPPVDPPTTTDPPAKIGKKGF